MTAVGSLVVALIRAHVLQQPFRTLLTIVGVALGVLASVAITTANVEVLRAFERAVLSVAGPATLEIVGHDFGLDETVIAAVRNVPGVVRAAPVIEETIVVAEGPHRGESIEVYGLDLIEEADRRGFHMELGLAEEALNDLLAPDNLYLGRQLGIEWNLAKGSTLDVMAGPRIARIRVAGLVHGDETHASLWKCSSIQLGSCPASSWSQPPIARPKRLPHTFAQSFPLTSLSKGPLSGALKSRKWLGPFNSISRS